MSSEKKIKAYACHEAKKDLVEFEYEPLPLGPHDVHIKIIACGCCHSDLHHVDGDWKSTKYPVVPGHEIIGIVTEVGPQVSKFKMGQRVGVGTIIGSCGKCGECEASDEQYCTDLVLTYGSYVGVNYITRGGYAEEVRVPEKFVYSIPDALKSEEAAPLLCAGITTFDPLVSFGLKKGDRVAILGIGGLGHLGVQFSHALGYEVTAISTSASKEQFAKSLGAHKFINSNDKDQLGEYKRYFDFILNTVSGDIDIKTYLPLIKTGGKFCYVGVPASQIRYDWGDTKRRVLVGCSMVGGIKSTQKMLDFCAEHNIKAMVETLPMTAENVNKALEKIRRNEPKFRVVLVNS